MKKATKTSPKTNGSTRRQSKEEKKKAEIAETIARLDKLDLPDEKDRKMIELFKEWLADESGYDEETWPILKKALVRNRKEWERGGSLMIEAVFLDAGPLGLISHPRPGRDIVNWLSDLL